MISLRRSTVLVVMFSIGIPLAVRLVVGKDLVMVQIEAGEDRGARRAAQGSGTIWLGASARV